MDLQSLLIGSRRPSQCDYLSELGSHVEGTGTCGIYIYDTRKSNRSFTFPVIHQPSIKYSSSRLNRYRQPTMLTIYPPYRFVSGYRKLFQEKICGSCAQEGFVAYPGMLGGWYAPAHGYEVSPWAWQWGGERMIQMVCFTSERRVSRTLLLTFMHGDSHSHGFNFLMARFKRRLLSFPWSEDQCSTTINQGSLAHGQLIHSQSGLAWLSGRTTKTRRLPKKMK